MRQQSRRDDMMRNILNMFMQKKQFEMQDRRYQDQTEQQKFQNKMAEKKYELDAKEAEDRGNYYNRPQPETEGSARRRAIMNNPNLSDDKKQRLLSGLDLYDPLELERGKAKIKSEFGTEGDKNWNDRFNHFMGVGNTKKDSALLASGITPTSLFRDREEARISAPEQKIESINERFNAGEITPQKRDELISIAQGQSSSYYESERDKKKRRAESATNVNKAYLSAVGVASKYKPNSKDYVDIDKTFRDAGIYIGMPKSYSLAKNRVEQGVADETEMLMVSTLDYMYDFMERGGSLDDFPIEQAEGMDKPTVLLFRRKYQQKYGGREYR